MTRPGLRFAFVGLGLWIAGGLIGLAAYPAARPAAPGGAQRDRGGAALHRADDRGHQPRLRARPHRVAPLPGRGEPHRRRPAQERHDDQEHPPVGAPPRARLLRPAPGDPHLLQVRGRGQRPVPARRGVPAGDAVRPRALARPPAEPDLDQRAPRVHARVRRRGGAGQPGDARRGCRSSSSRTSRPSATGSLKITRPEVYYGELAQRVRARQDARAGAGLPRGRPERLHDATRATVG